MGAAALPEAGVMTTRVHLARGVAVEEGRARLRGEVAHYLRNVLRLGPGDTVILFDDEGYEREGVLERLGGREAVLRLGPARPSAAEPAVELTLLFCLIKGDAADRVIRGATEVGVSRFLPVLATRSVARPSAARAEARRERWQRIALEACRQCGRSRPPEIGALAELEEALARPEVTGAGQRLFFATGEGRSLSAALAPGVSRLVLAVGPEGGFTSGEEAALEAAGFERVNLGPRVLRAVTAGVVAPALVLGRLEN
jgi:16S rRNA (uracil1498-N3)-methyltransferase